MITLSIESRTGSYKAYWNNGNKIGDFLIGDDGYYAYWPIQKSGYITSCFMREVADKLDELNEEWDKIIQSDPDI